MRVEHLRFEEHIRLFCIPPNAATSRNGLLMYSRGSMRIKHPLLIDYNNAFDSVELCTIFQALHNTRIHSSYGICLRDQWVLNCNVWLVKLGSSCRNRSQATLCACPNSTEHRFISHFDTASGHYDHSGGLSQS